MWPLPSRRQQSSPDEHAQVKFPTRQLFILALCRICEPIAFMSIFPYIYYMIASFEITSDDRQIAIYAGMVTSAFAFAEFSTSVIWGRLSDMVGRKPILLMGLAGTGLSMLIFGFAPNLQVALIARAVGGLLNGNIGVLQTTVAEVVKVKDHQPRAYAIMPFVWCLGSIIGSSVGGTLANPVENYPAAFGRGTVFETFPYLLPNLVCAVVVLCSLVIGILFLEETHEKKKHRRDFGLELGAWLLNNFRHSPGNSFEYVKLADATFTRHVSVVEDEGLAYFDSAESLSRVTSFVGSVADPPHLLESSKLQQSAGKAFNKQVVLNIISFGILAYHTISFEQLLPVLLSMSKSPAEPVSVFKFTGGFGLSTKTIGLILSLQGVYQMAVQMLLFPTIVRKFGSLSTFRFVALTYPLLYFIVPYLALLPEYLRMPGLAAILAWKVTYQSLAYPSNMLLLTNAVPSLLLLGVVNGIAASAASLSRAIGPTLSGLIQSAGLNMGCSGLAWWASSAVCVIGSVECLWMVETPGRLDPPAAHPPKYDTDEYFRENETVEIRLSSGSDTTLVAEEMEEVRVLAKC